MKKLLLMAMVLVMTLVFSMSYNLSHKENIAPESFTYTSTGTWASESTEGVTVTFYDSDFTIVSGNCVDRAIAAVNILNRHSSIEDVYIAVTKVHAQPAKKEGDSWKFMSLSGLTVTNGEPEFKYGDNVEFFKPEDFIMAARKFKPDMTLEQLKSVAKPVYN